MNSEDGGPPSSEFKTAARRAGLHRAPFFEPGGWLIYNVVDSQYIQTSLTEVRTQWTFGHLADAFRRHRFYAARDEIEFERRKPKSKPKL